MGSSLFYSILQMFLKTVANIFLYLLELLATNYLTTF